MTVRSKSLEDRLVDGVNYVLLIAVFIATFYPFWYLLIVSFNEGMDTALGGIYLWPRQFTVENYSTFLNDPSWIKAFGVSVARTVVGACLGLFVTSLVAYGLATKQLVLQKFYYMLFIVGMYVSGGLIPYYVILRQLHLLNTFYVYVVPTMLNLFFLIIAVSFFRELPPEMEESAKMDGANEWTVFARIILPVSKPLLATMALFLGVGQWNSWLDSAYFVQSDNLRTLTFRMIDIINKGNVPLSGPSGDYASKVAQVTPFSLQVTAMVIAVLPIVCVYPFLQKYFVKGATIGAVKG
ncbi:carbohydrate ABC transporter permease [Cohnella zeiphila]|uniref:Carbohydrate ABC transporter permease n=1 Tax=Cohnella zeiphila TaxID=2761120 RepID=A0A7X0SJA5_9BACL|nr:carbohydrate ABC transporter permease [Cohnella zeiphila]MBB6731023.1 carbohydrate ABC transporter permease [Cohnella zeiphila]